MPISLIIAHPDPSSLSFQIYHELAEVLESEGHKVFRQDLYGDSFNPVMPLDELKRRMSLDPLVTRYSRELTESESIVIIHPDWWAGPPAILKGWVDRVFRPGTAYDEIRDFPEDDKKFFPLLTLKKAAVITLSYRNESSRSFKDFWGDTVFDWCGIMEFKLYHLNGIADLEWEETGDWMKISIDSIRKELRSIP